MTASEDHERDANDGPPKARCPSPLDRAIGIRLRRYRRFLKVTQAKAARAIGVSPPQMQKYETGINRITLSALIRLAQLFKMLPQRFLHEMCEDIDADQPKKK